MLYFWTARSLKMYIYETDGDNIDESIFAGMLAITVPKTSAFFGRAYIVLIGSMMILLSPEENHNAKTYSNLVAPLWPPGFSSMELLASSLQRALT